MHENEIIYRIANRALTCISLHNTNASNQESLLLVRKISAATEFKTNWEVILKVYFLLFFPEDRDKLKKHNFATLVVEKVGDMTNQIIVAEGEDKSRKLAEASEKMQKQFESLSSKPLKS